LFADYQSLEALAKSKNALAKSSKFSWIDLIYFFLKIEHSAGADAKFGTSPLDDRGPSKFQKCPSKI
jgi:hypothetical protein